MIRAGQFALALAALAAGSSAMAEGQAGPTAKARADFPVSAAISTTPGEAAFRARCGYCHLEMGFGTLTLMKVQGPQKALLANRTDLDGQYVRTVVRGGLLGMPPITRAEASDGELDAIVQYLTRNHAGK